MEQANQKKPKQFRFDEIVQVQVQKIPPIGGVNNHSLGNNIQKKLNPVATNMSFAVYNQQLANGNTPSYNNNMALNQRQGAIIQKNSTENNVSLNNDQLLPS